MNQRVLADNILGLSSMGHFAIRSSSKLVRSKGSVTHLRCILHSYTHTRRFVIIDSAEHANKRITCQDSAMISNAPHATECGSSNGVAMPKGKRNLYRARYQKQIEK